METSSTPKLMLAVDSDAGENGAGGVTTPGWRARRALRTREPFAEATLTMGSGIARLRRNKFKGGIVDGREVEQTRAERPVLPVFAITQRDGADCQESFVRGGVNLCSNPTGAGAGP